MHPGTIASDNPAVTRNQGDVAANVLLYMGRVKSVRPIKSQIGRSKILFK